MVSLFTVLSPVTHHLASFGAQATCAIALLGAAASCTGPETSVRRQPVQLVVEPATFDDEDPAPTPDDTPRPRATEPREAKPQVASTAEAKPQVATTTEAKPQVATATEAKPQVAKTGLPATPAQPLAPVALPKRPSALSASGRDRCEAVRPEAERLAAAHEVDVALLMAIARVESDYNPDARNRSTGATGLMQVMPSTGKHFKCGDLTDAADNLECGVRVLRRYIDYFKGDLNYAVAAYHAGPKWSMKAKTDGLLPNNYSYIEKVMQLRTRFMRRGCE